MAKEEYETPLIDVYNRTHMDALHEDGGWYHQFLPDGVLLEDLGQIIEEQLIEAYNKAELESDDFFNIATTVLAKSIAEAVGKITKEEWDAYRKNFEIDKEDFKLVEKVWSKDFSPSAFAKELAKRYRKKKLILDKTKI